MALKNVLLTIGVAPDQVNFVVKGNVVSYQDIAGIADVAFDAVEVDDAGWKKVMGVITPIVSLLESGSFKRLVAREKAGKRSREVIVPASEVPKISAAIESSTGLSVGGVLCGSVAQGLRRVAR